MHTGSDERGPVPLREVLPSEIPVKAKARFPGLAVRNRWVKRPGLCASLSLLLLLPPEAGAGSFQAEASGLRLELTSEPGQPIQGRETVYTLSLRVPAGRQVTGAKVTLMGKMPDGMTVLAPLRETPRPGLYSGRVLFTMEGEWRLTVRIIQSGIPLELSFPEQVGR